MKTRRDVLKIGGVTSVGLGVSLALKPLQAVAGKTVAAPNVAAGNGGPKPYAPQEHQWRMVVNIEKCIGCGLCAKACKKENKVPPEPFYYRTWVERYVIKTAEDQGVDKALRGETIVDSPNGGIDGFPPSPVPPEKVLKSFFVPKLCNQCDDSPCAKACPVGAAFESPDGVALVDNQYCIGCGFCIQSCPYGCRFLNPITRCAEKCTLCYHRITKGLRPACVEVCPTGARIFGDMKNSAPDNPVRLFVKANKVQVLKPHLGTNPKLYYAGLDKEVR